MNKRQIYREQAVEIRKTENTEVFIIDRKKYTAMGFSCKKTKPDFHSRYMNNNHMEECLSIWAMNKEKSLLEKKEREVAEKKRRDEVAAGIKVGDIFVASWGYDQTNVDAYQVVARKGKVSVVIREIGYKTVYKTGEDLRGIDCDRIMPVKDQFLEISPEISKRLVGNCIRISDVETAWLWDGKSDYYRSWYV